ncbi:MAG: hypothetical protein JNN15_13190 [Blastocatellia bacterium]|nr:hypothetical protein [Blastocatellia bacterium]
MSHTETVRKTFSRNVLIDIAARIGYLLTRFLVPPFVLKYVTLDSYGLWATTFILVSYLGISSLGISNVYIKFTAEYIARGATERANRLISTGLMISIPVCLLLFSAVYFCLPEILTILKVSDTLKSEAEVVLLMVVAIFLLSLSLSAFRDLLVGAQQLASVQLIWTFSYLIETLLILVLVGSGHGVRGLAEAFLIRTLIEIVLSIGVAFRKLDWLQISPRLFSSEALQTLLSFGSTVQISGLLSIVLNSIERAIAVPMVGLAGAAIIDIGKKLPAMAASIPSAFASSLIPASSYLQGGLKGDQQREAQQQLYLKSARYMNLTSAFVCGLLATISTPLLYVWLGKNYTNAPLLMVIFAISTQLHLMTGPGTSLLKGQGKPLGEFHYIVPNILFLLLFVPLLGISFGWSEVSVSIAVASATACSAAYFINYVNDKLAVSQLDYIKTVVFPGIIPYFVGMLFSLPTTILVSHSSRFIGVAVIISTGICYTAILAAVILKLSDRTERVAIIEIASRFLPSNSLSNLLLRFEKDCKKPAYR